MNAIPSRILCAIALTVVLLAACGPKPAPGEKDREEANKALDQMPK
ncbi:MAG: hypothetical protein AAB214_19870 [Fibrobacterota bacterium]